MVCHVCGRAGCDSRKHWTKCSSCGKRGHNKLSHEPSAKKRLVQSDGNEDDVGTLAVAQTEPETWVTTEIEQQPLLQPEPESQTQPVELNTTGDPRCLTNEGMQRRQSKVGNFQPI